MWWNISVLVLISATAVFIIGLGIWYEWYGNKN